jgi:hypothetical protein
MDFAQATMLSKYWAKHPHMLFGAGVGGEGRVAESVAQAQPTKYATQEEVQQLLGQYGPRRA